MFLLSLALGDRIRALQEAARRLLESQGAHNLSLARDLHDTVGHTFALIRRAAEELSDERARPEARLAIAALAEEGAAESREIAHGLYPQRLLDAGLEGALQAAADLTTRSGLPVALSLPPAPLSALLTPAARLTALRVAEEALQNALRHSGASRLWLRLGAGAGGVTLEVEDDGRGFGAGGAAAREGLGTRTMRDRALQAHGALSLSRGAAGGALVRLVLPGAGAGGGA